MSEPKWNDLKCRRGQDKTSRPRSNLGDLGHLIRTQSLDPDTFERAGVMLTDNCSRRKTHGGNKFPFLFTGLLSCEECDERMAGRQRLQTLVTAPDTCRQNRARGLGCAKSSKKGEAEPAVKSTIINQVVPKILIQKDGFEIHFHVGQNYVDSALGHRPVPLFLCP